MPTLKGTFKLTLRNTKTGEVTVVETENTFVRVGMRTVLNLLGNQASVVGIQYISIGTDGTVTSTSDVSLRAEVARVPMSIATKSISEIPPSSTFSSFYDVNTPSSTQTLQETGIFATGATGASNTGDLVARAIFTSLQKITGVHTLEIDYTLTGT